MPFRYLPDVALADIAFEAESDTPSGLFETCALAISDIMVDPKSLRTSVRREFSLDSPDLDRLLYDFMTELIVLKDVDSLLFSKYDVRVSPDGRSLSAAACGVPIEFERQRLRNDVKAVTLHLLGLMWVG